MKAFLLILLTLAVSAQARIGETPAQCHERYGNPLGKFGPSETGRRYETNGFVIFVGFRNDRAEWIRYQRQATNVIGQPEELSKTEIAALLSKNSGAVWTPRKNGPLDGEEWDSADGCYAQYSGRRLEIKSAACVKREEDQKKKDATDKIVREKSDEERRLKGL